MVKKMDSCNYSKIQDLQDILNDFAVIAGLCRTVAALVPAMLYNRICS